MVMFRHSMLGGVPVLFACMAEVKGILAVVVFIYWYGASPSVAVGWQKDVLFAI
jgi:hypothetical protein